MTQLLRMNLKVCVISRTTNSIQGLPGDLPEFQMLKSNYP